MRGLFGVFVKSSMYLANCSFTHHKRQSHMALMITRSSMKVGESACSSLRMSWRRRARGDAASGAAAGVQLRAGEVDPGVVGEGN